MADSSENVSSPTPFNDSEESNDDDCFSPELLVETSMNFSSLPEEMRNQIYQSECIVKKEVILPNDDSNCSDDDLDAEETTDSNQVNQTEELNTASEEVDSPIPSKKKRVAVRESNKNRKVTGEFFTIFKEARKDRKKFYEYLGMELETFDYILSKVRRRLTKPYRHWTVHPIVAEERFVIFLRYLTVGMSFNSLAASFKLGTSTVIKMIHETAEVVWDELQPLHMPLPSALQFKGVADDFHAQLDFPHALGFISGKHLSVRCPDQPESLSRKANYSVVLHLATSAQSKVLLAEVGCFGKYGWEWSFVDSPLYEIIKNLKIPAPMPLPLHHPHSNQQIKVPFEFLAPSSYPILNFLLRPYSKLDLERHPWKAAFNSHLERVRLASAERTFQLIFQHWRLLQQPLATNLAYVGHVLKCACVLHNLLMDREPDYCQLHEEASVFNAPDFRLCRGGRGSLQAIDRRDVFGKLFAAENNPEIEVSDT